MPAVTAERVSLSPNLISDTDTVSFSFTIGITPAASSAESVEVAFRYRDRCKEAVSARHPRGPAEWSTNIREVVTGQEDLRDWLIDLAEKVVP